MFDLGMIFGAADLASDVSGIKQRQVRQIKFFRYKEGDLGIAFFDNQTVFGGEHPILAKRKIREILNSRLLLAN